MTKSLLEQMVFSRPSEQLAWVRAYINTDPHGAATALGEAFVRTNQSVKQLLLNIQQMFDNQTYQDAVIHLQPLSSLNNILHYRLTEQPIYGSARLGVRNLERTEVYARYLIDKKQLTAEPEDPTQPLLVTPQNPEGDISTPLTSQPEYSLTLGNKQYELSNHLGNVQVTLSDKKLGQAPPESSSFTHYLADVRSAADYYPFGMQMPGRSLSGGYRWGFNGKENDQETKTQDYGFRIYNPGIARFLSVDPLTKSYPWYTPFQFAGNKPIVAVDLDGLEEFFAMDGSFIGIGLKDDKRKMLVLQTQTARSIAKMTEAERVEYLNNKPFDIIVAPTQEFISKVREVINKSVNIEYGFVYGVDKEGNFVYSDIYEGDANSWDPNKGIKQLRAQGFQPYGTMHGHPSGVVNDGGTIKQKGGVNPSETDFENWGINRENNVVKQGGMVGLEFKISKLILDPFGGENKEKVISTPTLTVYGIKGEEVKITIKELSNVADKIINTFK